MAKRPPAAQGVIPQVAAQAPSRDIVKVEKNLNYISFFSPSKSRRGKAGGAPQTRLRVISYPPRGIEGQTVYPKTTIKPDPQLGLPTTADRDKYMAFMKIVTDRKARLGRIENPIGFTTYELLKHLGLTDAGFHYEEVNQFLERMVSTTIKSEYAVYFHGTKKYAKDIFHVFNRAVLTGQEMPDGAVAQMNYVYLSDWQLENINANYTFPIDFNSYRLLSRDIAKALFGHLHTWFYASRGKPVERKYSELCELLDIQRWPHISKARQILKPPLDELIGIRYFRSWELVPTVDRADFKLIMVPGDRMIEVTRPRLGAASAAPAGAASEFDLLVKRLVDRGVRETDARRILFGIDLEKQRVADQIEWFDDQVRRMGTAMVNPPGFLLVAIRENWSVPVSFASSRRRELQAHLQPAPEQDPAAIAEAQRELRRLEMEDRYQEWVERQVDDALTRNFTREELRKRTRALRKEILARNPGLYSVPASGECPALDEHARRALRDEVRRGLALSSLEEFSRRPQGTLF